MEPQKTTHTSHPRPHVLLFSAPAQGHINPMLKLAELLSLASIKVTFLITQHSHHQLTHHSDVLARFSRFPGFQFCTITDGLVWKLGLDMKDLSDRQTVANMVNDLMVNRKEEFVKSAAEMANLATRSVNPNGSSYAEFDRLVEDIRSLSARPQTTVES